MLDPSSLLAPGGPVTIALLAGDADAKAFGTKEAVAALTAHLTAAYADDRVAALPVGSTRDAAARSFALWKIHLAAYVGMLNRPATLTVTEKGGHGYSSEQIKGMKALADQYQAEFDDVVTTVPAARARSEPFVRSYLTF